MASDASASKPRQAPAAAASTTPASSATAADPAASTSRLHTKKYKFKGQLATLQNVSQMVLDIAGAAESKTDLMGNDAVGDMVR